MIPINLLNELPDFWPSTYDCCTRSCTRTCDAREEPGAPEEDARQGDKEIEYEVSLWGDTDTWEQEEEQRTKHNVQELHTQNDAPQPALEEDDALAVQARHVEDEGPEREEHAEWNEVVGEEFPARYSSVTEE
jgi:hypothetical protein